MPELPEVEALAHFLREHAVGEQIGRVDVAALSVVKSFDPPISALTGRTVGRVGRVGKYLLLDCDGVILAVHLARAGWLRWSDAVPAAPARPGRGPLALRVHLESGAGFDLTEAGTRKSMAVWAVEDPQDVPRIAALGPDAATIEPDEFAAVLAEAGGKQIKTVLTDQRILAGIGNAYSDEILHRARLSPFAPASGVDAGALHAVLRTVLVEAVGHLVGQDAARLKAQKRLGLAVHARTGLPCPVCGDTVREVSYRDRSMQYCPSCQTGGKILADRRMSKLLK
ncbi:Fpg/Nei family DNA glycosylase [Tomitella biformata]|uniref:Fpg/Nei family DNA glycosylase n=1 Tax=Tomitella biformata TaxID=630403 RepID=UPI00046469E4|nr:DNA-formamidopyrimidine glycosylase family protein [Tomitella biformata]